MPVDQSLVGREFPPTAAYAVTAERLHAFAAATAGGTDPGDPPQAPPTFPIVLAFDAMNAFLEAEGIDLYRIVHGEQRFTYERPIRVGDVLSAQLQVTGLRQIAGNDIITTTSRITDAGGELVCATSATLVHRGAEA